jgi:hypothetical protein
LGVEGIFDWRVKDGDADLPSGVNLIKAILLLGWNISVLKTILGGW